MKTSWGKPVHIIPFCRTLLIVLAVAAGSVAADDLQTLRKKADQGDAKAVKWYRKAAEQGLVDAQYNLGVRYANGRGGTGLGGTLPGRAWISWWNNHKPFHQNR